ncbi:putative conidial development protein fluffy [Triangularia verruculosa]|uniref:Conidial development protein fluffy n=1 Tax=Triangularia verruculosa TaxID=2587418 RepID=A0AAN7ATK3_9PEZI|nr:putative conidial development protein fluffy [Triangularia verruculosa]
MPRQHLTPNACLVCRKKRTKCDGQIPCRRCRSRGEECLYEDKKWRTKDHLRSEIERLRAEQRQGEAVIQALVDNKPDQWEVVQDRMRADESPDAIAEWIRSLRGLSNSSPGHRSLLGGTPVSGPNSLMSAPFQSRYVPTLSEIGVLSTGSLSEPGTDALGAFTIANGPGHEGSSGANVCRVPNAMEAACRSSFSTDLVTPGDRISLQKHGTFVSPPLPFRDEATRSLNPPLEMTIPAACSLMPNPNSHGPLVRAWTTVTSDTHLIQRLLSRFFSGSFPCLSLISYSHFIRDFREGTTRYCSEALVNAILGTSCRLSNATSQLISRISFGDAFVGEAKRLLAAETDHVNLPSIQALGILALGEMSQGNDEEAETLIRESVRASVHFVLSSRDTDVKGNEDFRVVRALAYCGVFSLMRFLRLLTGDLEPKAGPLFIRLQSNPVGLDEDTPQTRVERGIALQTQFFAELRFCPPSSRFVFEVTETSHTFLSYNYSRAMTANDLEGAYDRCVRSYRQFTESSPPSLNPTQDILLAQIWYHFCMLNLMRPFVSSSTSLVDGLPPKLPDAATPGSICHKASESIISLTGSYQTRHSLTYLPPLLPYMVFTAVLYQLTSAVSPVSGQQGLAESPSSLSPHTGYQSPLDTASSKLGVLGDQLAQTSAPRPGLCSSASEPLSPNTGGQSNRIAHRRFSCVSALSPGFSSSEQSRRASGCSFLSSTPLDQDEVSSSDAESDMFPVFSSQPSDLVTVGSLQLASMSARHPGAAEASRLLRGLGNVRDVAEVRFNLASLTASLPFPAVEFGASILLTGLGLQKTPVASVVPGASAFWGGLSPVMVPRVESNKPPAADPSSTEPFIPLERAPGN